jgi:dTDP-glucose pyrophosphorylase
MLELLQYNNIFEGMKVMGKEKPTLVIMAAGMGSRFGGLKQIAPVDDAGHIIIDYSLFDARRAGFREVVCIINPAVEPEFVELFKDKWPDMNIRFAHQVLTNLPQGYTIPPGREKPWGTAHAIMSIKNHVKGPFAVINADDFYGADAYKVLYNFLLEKAGDTQYALVGYRVENTLSQNGGVTRGVCAAQNGMLVKITETDGIRPAPGGAVYDDNGKSVLLPNGTPVSMNMWGFGPAVLAALETRFTDYLNKNLHTNPLKCEYPLPTVIGELLDEGKITVEILHSADKWYGVTYAEDMPGVRAAVEEMKQSGNYF